jgi:hypothetical protein
MLDIPSRAILATLAGAAAAVCPTAMVGIARRSDPAHVSVLYSNVYGIGEYLVLNDELPDVFAPSGDGPRLADAEALGAKAADPIQWHMSFARALARVIESEPDWGRLPADTPALVRRLLQRCLTKDPRCRLRDIGDAVLDLDDSAIREEPAARSGTRPPRRTALRWGAAANACSSGCRPSS